MATTPNAQLTKLALGIASVAALAGITGRLSGGAVKAQPNTAAQQSTLPADQTYQQVVKPTLPGWAQQPAPAEAPRYESRERHGDDDDEEEWEEEEGEHEGRSFLFFSSPSTTGTGTQAGQTQRRTRSGHS